MKQFRDYRIFVLLPIAAISVQLGIWWGAGKYESWIMNHGSAEMIQLERWKGQTQALVPWTMMTVTAAMLLAWRLLPVPKGNDRAALKEIAEQKLSQPLLTEAETELWSTVLDEVNR